MEDAISLIKERVKQKAKMQKDNERKKILQLLEKAEMQKDEDRSKINKLWEKIMNDWINLIFHKTNAQLAYYLFDFGRAGKMCQIVEGHS